MSDRVYVNTAIKLEVHTCIYTYITFATSVLYKYLCPITNIQIHFSTRKYLYVLSNLKKIHWEA